ncbi:MAG TPA: hypothetical protein VLL54_11995 [Pyrinomonadaceae bacterium]|nr:hypothetical protein [Pyrinomonadaceae bacterium]
MRRQTKLFFNFLFLLSLVGQTIAFPTLAQSPSTPPQVASLAGRWRVKFHFEGDAEKNLIFEASAKNRGSFSLLDTGLDDKPVPELAPAVWSELTNSRVSFSGDAEMPLGTCCREIGTLIFKGKIASNNAISGGVIFITSIDEEESPVKYRTRIGTFNAVRVP